jgi:phage shock protein E
MSYNLKDATIVDVRSPQEFAQDHYPGAINIPVDQVPQRVQEFKEMKTPIVAYCRSGNRSGMAVSILKQAGVQEVYNGGGLEDLQQQTK